MARTKRQFIISSQQIAFIDHYANPQSKTYGNALRSALKAGYSPSYARVITVYYRGEKMTRLKSTAENWGEAIQQLKESERLNF